MTGPASAVGRWRIACEAGFPHSKMIPVRVQYVLGTKILLC